MTLNEAIKHARDTADNRTDLCEECRAEHKQLAEWLEELKRLKEADMVEVRHGRWLSAYEYALKIGATDEKLIENAKEDKRWKFCCHCEQSVKWDYHYCPTCGARMDGERR